MDLTVFRRNQQLLLHYSAKTKADNGLEEAHNELTGNHALVFVIKKTQLSHVSLNST